MAFWPSWSAQVCGRLLAGLGGVLLNVIMSKMVTDWFAGREIASAMAIFVNSWPVGIALALIALPPVGVNYGVPAVYLISSAAVAVGFITFAALYRAPPAAAGSTLAGAVPAGRALAAVLVAGLIWSLFNVAFAMIFGFGPTMLTERGWSVAAAGVGGQRGDVADDAFRACRRFSGGLDQATCRIHRVGRRPVCSGPGVCRPHGSHARKFRCPRHRLRAACWSDHEPAGARSGASDPCHRHGHLLHRVLRRHVRCACYCRPACNQAWWRKRRLRLRCGRPAWCAPCWLGRSRCWQNPYRPQPLAQPMHPTPARPSPRCRIRVSIVLAYCSASTGRWGSRGEF